MKEIYKKLAAVKKEIGTISKDSKNPFFKSKYFDINQLLAHVEPLLEKNGLILLQPIENKNVSSMISLVSNPDETIVSSIPLPDIQDPQKLGSAITYYRRYTLASLLALQAEDDDANNAAKPVDDRPWLNTGSDQWKEAVKYLSGEGTIEKIEAKYKLSKENREKLITESI